MSENATTKNTRKSSQVSTTVSPEVFKALEDYRWPAHKKMTEVVSEALDLFIAKHGIVVGGAEAPADSQVAGKPTPKA